MAEPKITQPDQPSNADAPIGSGAKSGLEAIYLEKREALARFLRARGAGEQAEDLVQDLWLRLASAGSSPIADPVGYLYRAAHNLMINRQRSTERTQRRDDAWSASGPLEEASSEAAVIARQEIAAAEYRLRELGQRVLKVFIMFRVEGASQKEIAAQLGISLSAVEKDLQRAYRAIANLRSGDNAG